MEERRRKEKEGINNQKDKLLSRGKAISATPSMRGISQLARNVDSSRRYESMFQGRR